jgi:hypothetical protein
LRVSQSADWNAGPTPFEEPTQGQQRVQRRAQLRRIETVDQELVQAAVSAPGLCTQADRRIAAMDLLLTGRVIGAAEAERIGLLARVWAPQDWDQALRDFSRGLAAGPRAPTPRREPA